MTPRPSSSLPRPRAPRPGARLAFLAAGALAAFTPAQARSQEEAPEAPAEPGIAGLAPLLRLGQDSPLRTSRLAWTQRASRSALGAERDLGEEERVTMQFELTPWFTFVDRAPHSARLGTSLAADVLVSDAVNGANEGEARLFDLPIEVAYRYTLRDDSLGLTVRAGPELGVWLPTSDASAARGVDARFIAGLTLLGAVPLRDGELLSSLFVAIRASYGHTFGGGNVSQVLFDVRGLPIMDVEASSDDTANDEGRFIGAYRDAFESRLDVELALYAGLSLGLALGIGYLGYDGDTTRLCPEVPSGTCIEEGDVTTQTFGVSLSYAVARVLGLTLAYENAAGRLGEDGEPRTLFGGPEAVYLLTTTVLLDGLHVRSRD